MKRVNVMLPQTLTEVQEAKLKPHPHPPPPPKALSASRGRFDTEKKPLIIEVFLKIAENTPY